MYNNSMRLELLAKSENEKLARVTVAAFVAGLNPTLEELADIKTAVSEAVTNAIVHGYESKPGIVGIECEITGRTVHIAISDSGVGIADVEKAREPMYTTKPEQDRTGMGFMFMEVFMDEVVVESKIGKGTRVIMKKTIEVEEGC